MTGEPIRYAPDRATVEARLMTGLQKLRGERCIRQRVDYWSNSLLGATYAANTLSDPRSLFEVLSISSNQFDCVTYCEFVYAASLSDSISEFTEHMKAIRYQGEISWANRNHYVSDWIRNGKDRGFFDANFRAKRVEVVDKQLSVLPSLPKRHVSLAFHPYDVNGDWIDEIQSGDFIAFGSNRYELDVFHCGILFSSDKVTIRHASRSGKGVIEETLDCFMDKNTGCGVLLAAPAPLAPRPFPRGDVDRCRSLRQKGIFV